MDPDALKHLPRDVDQCHEIIAELSRDIAKYQHQLEYLRRKLFGRSSERVGPGAPDFFGGQWGEDKSNDNAASEAEPPEKEGAERRRKPRGHGRRPLPEDLPRHRIEHEVAEVDKVCPDCGSEKTRIGEQTSEQLEYEPASLYVIEHVCPKYACGRCQGHVVQGEKPAQPIEKGLAGPGLLAHVITSK